MRLLRSLFLALCVSIGLCNQPALAQSRSLYEPKIKIVASFSILADFARQIGGDHVEVIDLVGPNGDAHVYQPKPLDVAHLAQARLVILNGLGLEGWFDRLIAASGAKPRLVIASQGSKLLSLKSGTYPAADQGPYDPHAWQDVANASQYVSAISAALIEADPAARSLYEARSQAYLGELSRLEAEVKAAISAIPRQRRRVITTHDAFGYFAKAYDIDFIAPQGVSTDAEATAQDVAKIIRQIKAERIPAVFLENVSDDRLIRRIGKESGAKIGGKVFSDALSETKGPAGSYIDMMRNNIREFTAALKP